MTYHEVLTGMGFGEEEVAALAPRRLGLSRCWAAITGSYLVLNATSPMVPGPATRLGLARHVLLLHHVDKLLHAVGTLGVRL